MLLLPANFIVDTVMLLLLFFMFKVPEKRSFTGGAFGKHGALGFWRIFWRQGFWSSSAVRFRSISYICAVFLCGGIFICNGWRSSGRGTDLLFPYKVRMEGDFIRGRKEKENRTGMAILTAPYLMYLSPL